MTTQPASAPKPPSATPRLLIAGTHSGVGKTSITAGLIRALSRRGLRVQPFKCGPDYIDPGFHGQAAGRPCRNLDSWMLSDEQVKTSFELACADADIALIEGVMGLFDGSSFEDERASAAQVAGLLQAPILLVVDISGSGRSAAAMVHGFQTFNPGTQLSGVLLNFAGSEGHARGCAQVIEAHSGLPLLGWLPRRAGLAVPERNLGLHTIADTPDVERLLNALADEIEAHFDVESLLRIAREQRAQPESLGKVPGGTPAATPSNEPFALPVEANKTPVLAVAMDEAFCFTYPDNLDLLRARGVSILPFSPLRGEAPPPEADGVYLGGGYPELHAETLSLNRAFFHALQDYFREGKPILAECGGFMVLTESIIDAKGCSWPMAGLVPGHTRMTDTLQSMGYRIATCAQDTLLGASGTVLRAHEFHYSVWDLPPGTAPRTAFLSRGTSASATQTPLGWAEGSLLGSYLHFHFGQDSGLVDRLVVALTERHQES